MGVYATDHRTGYAGAFPGICEAEMEAIDAGEVIVTAFDADGIEVQITGWRDGAPVADDAETVQYAK